MGYSLEYVEPAMTLRQREKMARIVQGLDTLDRASLLLVLRGNRNAA
jgi:hypothetical protein